MTTLRLDERVQCVIRSEVNQRPRNEDSFQALVIPGQGGRGPLYLLMIADGMGGHAHGEDVSREGLRKMSTCLLEELLVAPSINPVGCFPPHTSHEVQSAIQLAICQANLYLHAMMKKNHWGVAGATLVLALIGCDRAWVANLGDSPLFHWHSSTGELTQVTEDHTVTHALLRSGQISPAMADHHAYKNVLELYLGCDRLPDPLPFYERHLREGDRLLLCSDGVSGGLSLATLQSILSRPLPLEALAEDLIQASLAAESTDNQTLILWQHPAPTPDLASSALTTVLEFSQTPLSRNTLVQPRW
ncbi:PP2C family protein-serine/threonine phosphatase [Lyngbya confervoides]|uniref:Protein phosphatase 2C domain-containing protein n=1 Tax=Lyngbya confervoides BDU141951 TaxID=1574623 RepID=A0ABD4T2F8_9CYAN|nr:protein phosphatase 2C domain-containing protein [Lyngbya confervoides]MCM1982839.1 protein phosphatase 2C domain-containing protein [Lyngbya confervoides BDU141951]